ncbi:MAG: DUF5675 family protein [Marinilabiliaceae bacterium]|nr:DUF5675 family protein [Marinilabiliaceae bacterium]
MNQRLYDPVVGRFLAPDPLVSNPEFSKDFNRYSYALNNPLKYVDITGMQYTYNWDTGQYEDEDGNEADWNDVLNWINGQDNDGDIGGGFGGLGGFSSGVYGNGSNGGFGGGGSGIGASGGGGGIFGLRIGITRSLPFVYHRMLSIFGWKIYLYKTGEGGVLNSNGSTGFGLQNERNMGEFRIEVERILESENSTLSKFYAEGPIPLRSVEGYFLEPKGPATTQSGQNRRIPTGTYEIKPYSSAKYKNVYIVSNENVSTDRRILIHSGNYHYHTLGCLLPGSGYGISNGDYYVSNSSSTLKALRRLLGNNKAVMIIK